jgi:hypothetical protein
LNEKKEGDSRIRTVKLRAQMYRTSDGTREVLLIEEKTGQCQRDQNVGFELAVGRWDTPDQVRRRSQDERRLRIKLGHRGKYRKQ